MVRFGLTKWLVTSVTVAMMTACGGGDTPEVTSITYNGTIYGFVTSPYTGKVWLDRNLGAARVCEQFDDSACYGDYYQWGRNADGHEDSGSDTTDTPATDVTDVGHGKFIVDGYYWASVDRNGSIRSANWSKTDGTSICPIGFRVPTVYEIEAELLDEDSAEIQKNSTNKPGNSNDRRENAFNSFLQLPSAGNHYAKSGVMEDQGERGYLWSSSTSRITNQGATPSFRFASSYAEVYEDGHRPFGFPVRCLRD